MIIFFTIHYYNNILLEKDINIFLLFFNKIFALCLIIFNKMLILNQINISFK